MGNEQSTTWKEAAGRSHGRSTYQVGDVTRAVVRGTVGAQDQSWKEASGRRHGGSSYRFGDITRSVFRGAARRLSGSRGAGAAAADTATPGEGAEALPPPPPPAPPSHAVSALDVWGIFFSRAHEHGKNALRGGWIEREDVEDREVFLYIGLPALTLLEAVRRSVEGGPRGCLVTADGTVIGADNCPAGYEAAFRALLGAREALEGEAGARTFTPEDWDNLRRWGAPSPLHPLAVAVPTRVACVARATVLRNSEEGGAAIELREPVAAASKAAATAVVGVAIELSQRPEFKARFDGVFERCLEGAEGK